MLKAYKIAIVFTSLVVILFIAAAILPNRVVIERSIIMNVAPSVVFEQVNDLKNWPNWMPRLEQDTTIEISYSEDNEGLGASYTWVNTNKDSGWLKIKIGNSRNSD